MYLMLFILFSSQTHIFIAKQLFVFVAMTTWACASPSATILIMAAMLLLIFVCYYAMDKKHLESPSPPPTNESDNRGEYTALVTKGKPYKFYCFIFCCDQKTD